MCISRRTDICRHARQPIKSLHFKIAYISHLYLWLLQWLQLHHCIKELYGLIFTLFIGGNALCSVQLITLSFHCGIIGRRNSFAGFTGKKKKEHQYVMQIFSWH